MELQPLVGEGETLADTWAETQKASRIFCCEELKGQCAELLGKGPAESPMNKET